MDSIHFEKDLRRFDWYIFYIDIWKQRLSDDNLAMFAAEWIEPRIKWEHEYRQWRKQSIDSDSMINLTNTVFDPNSIFILAKSIPKLDTQSRQTPIAEALALGITAVLNYNPSGNYDDAIRHMMEELLNPKILGLDLKTIAGLIVDYINERNDLNLPPVFPSGFGIARLLAITKWIDNASKSLVVGDFLKNINEQDFKILLGENDLRVALFDERVWEIANSKAEEFMRGIRKRSPFKEMMNALRIERKEFLRAV